ncbi:hypothetical protein JQC91_13590 [Jannaschia sp. Os4]|uniref:hypothetical protein n=1 Tax=Jannaschia sp. Os4 TaxID=2807617 RepID=UPI00193AB1C3|nr:hypothetical protein [Jannaschia sp. Os4]MBM2577337.1 hypothetical protein [Jannaschia sp. Os4]
MTDRTAAPTTLQGPSASMFSSYEISALQERSAARRAEIAARASAAEAAAPPPSNEPPDATEVLWHRGGKFAGLFVLWVAFIAPNVYVASRLFGS